MTPVFDKAAEGSGACPNRVTLRSFLMGTLADETIESVARHLNACHPCETALRDLPAEDTLVAELRKHLRGDGPPWQDPQSRADRATALRIEIPAAPPGVAPARDIGGAYRVMERLGLGGMGIVFKARHLRLGRIVAVKLLRHGALANGEFLRRFRVEAEAIARLEHPHIVRLYDIGDSDEGPFFAMELVEGGNLAAKLALGPLPQTDAASLLERLARAVQYAHDRRIIHRDIKPANVLLAPDGNPKLGDFGLAKLLDAPDPFTHSHEILGTATYMAPEQARGGVQEATVAVDIYGLGAVLYETLTGVPPFRGSRQQVLDAIPSVLPVPPRQLQPDLSADLEAVCLKCLEKAPHDRYSSAEALADDLVLWLKGAPTRERPRRGTDGRRVGWRARILASVVACFGTVLLAFAAVWYFAPAPPGQSPSIETPGLLDAAGRPKQSRWLAGERADLESLEDAHGFAFQTGTTSLLEIAADPRWEHYRFGADIRQDDSFGGSHLGLFFGHRQVDGDGGSGQAAFFTLGYADRHNSMHIHPRRTGELASWVKLMVRGYAGDPDGMPPLELDNRLEFEPTLPLRGPAQWRHLEVEVSPEGVAVFWQDKPEGEVQQIGGQVTPQRLTRGLMDLRRIHDRLPLIPTVFEPRSGLGVYVCRGKASFRNLTLRPVGG